MFKMKITKTSNKGIDLIKSFEGFSSKPYLCPAKIPTIGYGATFYPNGKKVTMKDAPITESKGVELLKSMLVNFERYVDSYCIDTVNQNQFDALVSFCYNLGPANLKSSTLLKKVNANPNDPTIEAEFMKWTKAGGKTLKGLVRRREAESKLYFTK
jgi:lysozyme